MGGREGDKEGRGREGEKVTVEGMEEGKKRRIGEGREDARERLN